MKSTTISSVRETIETSP